MSDPAVIPAAPAPATPVVHVFTDAQLASLVSQLTPGPSFVSSAGTVVKTGAEDVLSNIKQIIADAEGTVTHVHGAAKQLQADVKANRVQIIIGVVAFAALAMQLVPLIRGLL